MRRYTLVLLSCLTICGLSVSSYAREISSIPTVSPKEHEVVKAFVIDPVPGQYTIDVETLSNLGVDEQAPTFAVYITNRVPDTCGDFRALELPYQKPEKYLRQFDLSAHGEVLQALDEYGCVVMRNIPSQG